MALAVSVAVGPVFAQVPPQGQPARKGPGAGPRRGPGAQPVAAVPAAPAPPPRIHRKGVDPFRIPWSVPPPPPYVFEKILPVRLADEDIEPPVVKPVTIREEPALRVSGIMTGDGVFAILEQAGKVDIVKPGSSVDISVSGGSRTYRVASIRDDTVTLESVEGLKTYQQIVPLSDAPIGTTPSSFGGGGGPPIGGRPGVGGPGSFGGGPGRRPGGGGGRPGLSPGGGPGKGAD